MAFATAPEVPAAAAAAAVAFKGRPAELTTNKTFVAYGEEKDFARIIASVGDFAENFHKSFEAEKYNFNVSYLYSAESFVVGRKAKVVLHGRLSMNDK